MRGCGFTIVVEHHQHHCDCDGQGLREIAEDLDAMPVQYGGNRRPTRLGSSNARLNDRLIALGEAAHAKCRKIKFVLDFTSSAVL